MTAERGPGPDRGRGNRAFGDYQPGLDGMRGIGMAFMLGYHGRIAHTGGAIFALSQFFTVSGFLITAILLDEQRRSQSVGLRAFWSRRFRRLAPGALLGLAISVVFGATIASPTQAENLPGEIAGALTYVVNWVFVFRDQSYVDLFADPSPVQHYWSLAIEEQFYLLLPLALLGLGRLRFDWRRRAILFGAGALASAAWAWSLFARGASIDRLYYGSDTRIGEILVGATFATVLHHVGHEVLRARRRLVTVIAVPAIALSWWMWTHGSITDATTWRGGFLLHSLLSIALVSAVIAGGNPIARLYSLRPFAWLGRITYSLYIFHWPIFLWLDEGRTGLSGWPLFGVRVATSVAAATASYYVVEQPIRHGATLGLREPRWRVLTVPVVGIAILVASTVFVSGHGTDATATIRDDASGPTASVDGSLDLVVIHTTPMRDVASAVERHAGQVEGVEVAEVVPMACPAVDTSGEGPVCRSWADTWPGLVDEHDPDTVLVLADEWEGADLAAAAEAAGATEADLVADVLTAGFGDLSAGGATVLWSTSGKEWLELGAEVATNALIQAMFDIDVLLTDLEIVTAGRFPSRDDLDPASYLEQAASALLEDAALYQRGERRGRERVLVLGDSQSRSLGYGLERWGDRTGEAWVWNAATPGCGLVVAGRVVQEGRELPPDPMCLDAAEDRAQKVARFDPDVVLVLSSSWDLEPRRLDGWDEASSPGDPRFDALVLETYVSVVDELSAHGAQVVWLVPPCPSRGILAHAGPEALDRYLAPLPVLQDEVIPALVEARPSVGVYDLDAVLCPGGDPLETNPVGDVLRPDGLHFSVEGSLWFAETHADEVLGSVRGG